MTKFILCLMMIALLTAAIRAQAVPNKISFFLKKSYAGWKPAPGFCGDKTRWFLRGDFDGDGLKDYFTRVKTGRNARKMKLHLVGFLNGGDGNYPAARIADELYTDELRRSTFVVLKKGSKISLDEGDGETIILKTDAVKQYICETDASKVFIYQKGIWKNIFE